MKLTMSGGRRVMASIAFVPPDDEVIAMAADDNVAAQAAAELGRRDLSEADIDAVVGITVQPVAQLAVFDDGERVESLLTLNKNELRRLIYDLRAVYESMDDSAKVADRTWARYRKQVRLESVNSDLTEG